MAISADKQLKWETCSSVKRWRDAAHDQMHTRQIFIEQSQVQMHFQTQKPTQNVLDVRKENPMYNTSKSTHTYTYILTFPHNKVIKCVPMIEQNPREAPRRAVPAVEMSNGAVTSSFQNISGWTILPAAPWTFKAAFWGTTALLCRSVNEAAAPPCYVILWILSPFTSIQIIRTFGASLGRVLNRWKESVWSW